MKMKNHLAYFILMLIFVSCNIKSKPQQEFAQKTVDSKPLQIEAIDNTNKKVCIDVVLDIIRSNNQCQELISNLAKQGVRYGYLVNASPNPTEDHADAFSENYEIILFESHPDYNHNFAFYRFSPAQKKLYKMNIVKAEYEMVDFDVKMISEFQKICSN